MKIQNKAFLILGVAFLALAGIFYVGGDANVGFLLMGIIFFIVAFVKDK